MALARQLLVRWIYRTRELDTSVLLTDPIIGGPRERPMDDALARESARWRRSYPVAAWPTLDNWQTFLMCMVSISICSNVGSVPVIGCTHGGGGDRRVGRRRPWKMQRRCRHSEATNFEPS